MPKIKSNTTFADASKLIAKKYKGRDYDSISQKTLDMEMQKLIQLNESARMKKDKSSSLQMAGGGPIDDTLLAAQRYQESKFNPNAVSPAGALGVAQFMPHVWEGLQGQGVIPKHAKATDPAYAIPAQRYLMDRLYKRFGDTEKALAAYNWGEGNLNKALRTYGDAWKDNLPRETRDYIEKVLGYQKQNVSDAGMYKAPAPPIPVVKPAPSTSSASTQYQTPLKMKFGGFHKSNYRLKAADGMTLPVTPRAGYFLGNYNNIQRPSSHTTLGLLSDVIGTATPVNPRSGAFSILGSGINNTPLSNPLNSAQRRTRSSVNYNPSQMGPMNNSLLYETSAGPAAEQDVNDPFDTAAYLRDNDIPLEPSEPEKERKPSLFDGMTPGDTMQLAGQLPALGYNMFQSFKPAQTFNPVRNEQAGQALGQLDRLKIDMQPLINEANLSFNSARRQLSNQMGGGSLAANLANLTSNTQRTMNQARLSEQQLNNQYATQAASARLQLGEADRGAVERARNLNIASEATKQQFAAAAATQAAEGLTQAGRGMNAALLNKTIIGLAKSSNFYYNPATGTIDFDKYASEHPEEVEQIVKIFGGDKQKAKLFLEASQ